MPAIDYGPRIKALTNEQRRGISIAALGRAKRIHAARLEFAAALKTHSRQLPRGRYWAKVDS